MHAKKYMTNIYAPLGLWTAIGQTGLDANRVPYVRKKEWTSKNATTKEQSVFGKTRLQEESAGHAIQILRVQSLTRRQNANLLDIAQIKDANGREMYA